MTTDLVGRRLGDFEVIRVLGRGGMGVVFEARQVSLNRSVALKVLGPGLGLTPTAVARFHREAEAAAKLHHTNIVPVYATGEADGIHFYAMELINGPSLDAVIRQLRDGQPAAQSELPPNLAATGDYVPNATPTPTGSASGIASSSAERYDRAAAMIADVADALHHAHLNGVTHRDIKPSNLLLSADGRLSVTDFGLARMLEQPGMTVTGEFVGTPAYMSPEQITAGRVPVDHRTDIYSLGATLYELLTLRPPFLADGRDMLLALVIQKEPPSPRRVNPKVPRDLETICLKCLEKDPDRRYATAKELADDLRRYVNRFAILAKRTGPVARLKKWAKRNPAFAGALACVLLFAVGAAAMAYRGHLVEQDRARLEAEVLAEKRQAALEKAFLASRMEDFDGARQAIREAEKLGCSAGQIHMLWGQLELYQGHLKEAINHLSQATDLLPESVAAWSMLAVAHNLGSSNTESERAFREATRHPAVTPEDHLFRGQAQAARFDYDRAIVSLDESVSKRDSALASMIRLEALRSSILDLPDADKARRAMKEAKAIHRNFEPGAMTLSLRITVYLACYYVFAALDLPNDRQEAYDLGMLDAATMAQTKYQNSIPAVIARWVFLDETSHTDLAIADLQRTATAVKEGMPVYYYAMYLYKTGNFNEAVAILDNRPPEMPQDLIRLVALADATPDGLARAHKLGDEFMTRDLHSWDRFNAQLMLRILGRKTDAVEMSQKFLSRQELFPPIRQEAFRRMLAYCAGRLSADDLIASMNGRRFDLCGAHLCVALTALADGNRVIAKQHLKRCVDTRQFEIFPYDLARMLLARMEKDPNWPPWIKNPKK